MVILLILTLSMLISVRILITNAMNMKYTITSTIVLFSFLPLTIAGAEEFFDSAKVVSTRPIVENLYAPAASCQHYTDNRNLNNTRADQALLGAALGGLAGSQAGRGRGKDAAAAAGAILGSKLLSGDGSFTGEELLGAIAGSVAGNQIGRGSGRTAATAAGAVLGSALASGKLSRSPETFSTDCGSNVVSQRVITSYNVVFEYNGYTLTSQLPYKPVGTIDVLVNVIVLEDRTL